MDKEVYINILDSTLLPFIERLFPNSHKFTQDNGPKHTSKAAGQWMEDNRVNWWKTPENPQILKPIKNVWHELKEYIRRDAKDQGWACGWHLCILEHSRYAEVHEYIKHLCKVIPKVIELNGAATGY